MIDGFDYSRAPRRNHTQRIAISGTPGNATLDTNIVGVGKLRVVAVGAEAQFYFTKESGDAVVANATGSGDTVGWSLLAGESEDFWITSETRIAHVGSGAGFLVLMRAGKERVKTEF